MSDQTERARLTADQATVKLMKWVVLVVLLCAAAAVIALPFPAPSWPPGEAKMDERLKVAGSRLYAVQVELRSAHSRYLAQSALVRWLALPANRRDAAIVIDETVPASGRAEVERAARAQWAFATGTDTARAMSDRAALFITADTGSIVIASWKSPLRASDAQYFALPAAGRPCVAMIRLRSVSESAIRGVTLGPCAFYARYGLPGDGMRAWLESTGGTMAKRSDVEGARTLEQRQLSVTSLDHSAGSCLLRGGKYCLEAIGLRDGLRDRGAGTPGPIALPAPGLLGSGPPPRQFYLGERSRWFLSDLAREIGDERFLAFWQSSDDLEVAFQKATGLPLEEWTQRWLQRGVMPITREAGVSMPNVAWFALAVPLLLAIAVRPRDRVVARPSGAR